MSLRTMFVTAVYADHNASRAVRDALDRLLREASADATILNIGAGETRLDPRVRTLEIEAAPGIDIVGSVSALPLNEATVDLVVTQEVLEHVKDPFLAMREIARVLKPGGKAYVQLPWTIGFHPCPDDFWRFSRSGIVQLVEQAGLSVVELGTTVGPATGAYRICVEFLAIIFSWPAKRTYHLFKGAFAIALYPLKWLDALLASHPEAGRIAGGFFAIVRK